MPVSNDHQDWSRLDNAGKLYPSITSSRVTTYFRISVRFRQQVDPERLRLALVKTLPRFPAFRVRLVAGLFWYSLAPVAATPEPIPDSTFPCMPLARRFRTSHLFRVRWWDRRLSVEFSHALTDGVGGAALVTALTSTYLGYPFAEDGPNPRQTEDAFQFLKQKGYPRSDGWSRAFHVPFSLLPRGEYLVVTGLSPLDAVQRMSHEAGLTITEFLCASYLEALQEVFETLPADRRRSPAPLRLVVPVNLRRFFPTPTLRNFFAVFPVEIDLRLGHYTFDEICRKVKGTFQIETDVKLIRKQIARNLRGELHPLARLAPLFVKGLYLSRTFKRFERQYTSSLSNIGALDVPSELVQELTDADFVPPPNPFTKVHCGVVSVGSVLSITFARQMDSNAVEKAFFCNLRRRGVRVRLLTNAPDEGE